MPITGPEHHRSTTDSLLRTIELASESAQSADPRADDAAEHQADHAILCATCSATITHRGESVQINNQHEHAFFNPAGIAFELRCFRRAPGVAPLGEPTGEFSWFPGYRWQVVLCTSCHLHLGWLFTGSPSFFGLIATRLV